MGRWSVIKRRFIWLVMMSVCGVVGVWVTKGRPTETAFFHHPVSGIFRRNILHLTEHSGSAAFIGCIAKRGIGM